MQTSSPSTLVCLHFLGGSARTWAPVTARLGDRMRVIPLDLPGFGDAHAASGATVAEMADAVASAIDAEHLESFVLAGHSMGAKVAAVLARRAEAGEAAMAGLRGLVLVAGSPPEPEPMDEAKRAEMLTWFDAEPETHRTQAQGFIDANVSDKLPSALNETAVEDVLRSDRDRWRAWLESGSREDWAERVGLLQIPTLIVAGADDEYLGPAAQAGLTARHFVHVRQVDLPDAKHLLPLERASAVAALIAEHAQ